MNKVGTIEIYKDGVITVNEPIYRDDKYGIMHNKPYDRVVIKDIDDKVTHNLSIMVDEYLGLDEERYKSPNDIYKVEHKYYSTGYNKNNIWIRNRYGVLLWSFPVCPESLTIQSHNFNIAIDSDGSDGEYECDFILDPKKIQEVQVTNNDSQVEFFTLIKSDEKFEIYYGEKDIVMIDIVVSKGPTIRHSVFYPNGYRFELNGVKTDMQKFLRIVKEAN